MEVVAYDSNRSTVFVLFSNLWEKKRCIGRIAIQALLIIAGWIESVFIYVF